MIRAVAFCPAAPVLVPDVAQGAAPELDDLRGACRDAIRRAHAPDRQWMLVGPGPTPRMFGPSARGTFAGLGVSSEVALGWDRPGPAELPLSLTVGAWLLHDALGTADLDTTALAVGGEAGVTPRFVADRDIALLVVGDGTARRGVKAPGYVDDRAAAYDESVTRALRSGDPGALAGLDASLGAELLAAGVPAWRAVGPALAGTEWQAGVLFADDPYGVAYLVASWIARA